MRILVTGGNGQVGFELQRQLCLLGDVQAPTRQELDLTDPAMVEAWLQRHAPSLVVNAAAYTAVDKAESEPALAWRLNAELPAQLAAYANERDATLVHYSSDYVYPGDGETPWREDDATAPLSEYGVGKLAGDEAVLTSGCRHLLLRTSWVYSARGHNFMKTMLRLGVERDSLAVVDDQIGAPTPARLIAEVTSRSLYELGRGNMVGGLYNLAPRGQTSWHGFACEIFRQAAMLGVDLAIVPQRVAAIPTKAYPTPAARPLNSRLALARIEAAMGIRMPDWRAQLALTLQERVDSE